MLMMLCAGASEQGVSQWASTFAEQGLGVTKTIGDLAGPMAFAILMGSSRAFYGKFGDRMDLDKFMIGSGVSLHYFLSLHFPCTICICVTGSAVPSADFPWESCGREASARHPWHCEEEVHPCLRLALAGDVGCSGGPTLVGFVSGILSDNLKKRSWQGLFSLYFCWWEFCFWERAGVQSEIILKFYKLLLTIVRFRTNI